MKIVQIDRKMRRDNDGILDESFNIIFGVFLLHQRLLVSANK
jgi:hypothetical protein